MPLHAAALALSLSQDIVINRACAPTPRKRWPTSRSLTSVNSGPGQRGSGKCANEEGSRAGMHRSKHGKTTHCEHSHVT